MYECLYGLYVRKRFGQMDMNDRHWTVYMKDAQGYPKIVKEHLCDSDSFVELQILRQAGGRCWREDNRRLS